MTDKVRDVRLTWCPLPLCLAHPTFDLCQEAGTGANFVGVTGEPCQIRGSWRGPCPGQRRVAQAAVPRATKRCQEPWHAADGKCAKTVGVTASLLPSFAVRDNLLSRARENGTCASFLAPTWHLCQEVGTAGRPEDAGTGAVNGCDQARQQRHHR